MASDLSTDSESVCGPAEAHSSWFHLYRLLLPDQGPAQDSNHAEGLAAAIEQFMQSASLGEYQRRLDLVWSFRQASLDCLEIL